MSRDELILYDMFQTNKTSTVRVFLFPNGRSINQYKRDTDNYQSWVVQDE